MKKPTPAVTDAQAETSLGVALTPERTGLVRRIAERFHVEDAKLVNALKSTVFRQTGDEKEQVTDAQMLMLLVICDQYGLNPFTREIFAFPDKKQGIVPIVSVDGWSRIINDNDQMDGIHFVTPGDDFVQEAGAKACPAWIECVIYRKDRKEPIKIKEYLDECYRPPFKVKAQSNRSAYEVAGPWQSHTKRMLRHKAMIQCARVAFGFVGIYDYDEGRSIIEGHIADVVDGELLEQPKSRTESAKDTLKKKSQGDEALRKGQADEAEGMEALRKADEVDAEIQDDKRKPDPDFPLPKDYGDKKQDPTEGKK